MIWLDRGGSQIALWDAASSTAELDGRGTSSSNIGTHPLNWQIRDSDARDIDFAVTGVV